MLIVLTSSTAYPFSVWYCYYGTEKPGPHTAACMCCPDLSPVMSWVALQSARPSNPAARAAGS